MGSVGASVMVFNFFKAHKKKETPMDFSLFHKSWSN